MSLDEKLVWGGENPSLKNILDELNGLTPSDQKLTTIVIQDLDIIEFNRQVEILIKKTPEETIFSYHCQTVTMPSQQGILMVFVAVLQIWETEENYDKWLQKIKNKSSIIKPGRL
jgi:hypothetical protein